MSEAQPLSQRPSSLTAILELGQLSCLSIHRLLEYLLENRPFLGRRAGQHPSRRASFCGALGTPARWQVGSHVCPPDQLSRGILWGYFLLLPP